MIDASIYDAEGLFDSSETVAHDEGEDTGYTIEDSIVDNIDDDENEDDDLTIKSSEETSNNGNEKSEDLITEFLKDRGIEDPSKLKFQNDDGDFEDVDFNSLTDKEKLNILKDLANEVDLSQEEIDVINLMRSNNVSFQQVLDDYAARVIEGYVNQNQVTRSYEIDDYSDDELFIADLKIKYPNFTDEELISKLETEKLNEDMYNKQVSALRDYYKLQEETEAKQIEAQRQEEIESFKNTIGNTLNAFNQIAIDPFSKSSDLLTIEQSDKQAIYDYLFTQDSSGMSQLAKDLNDPEMLVQLGWFMTQGNNIMNDLASYWKNTLKEERRQSTQLRKELESYKKKSSQTTVLADKKETTKTNKNVSNINQLWANLYN